MLRYSDCSGRSVGLKSSGKGMHGHKRGRPRKVEVDDTTTDDFMLSTTSSSSDVASSFWSDASNNNKTISVKNFGGSGERVQLGGQSSNETIDTGDAIDVDTSAVQFYDSGSNRVEPHMLMKLRSVLYRSSINVSFIEQQMLDDEILRLARIAEKALIPDYAKVLEHFFHYHSKLRRMIQIGKGRDILGNRRPRRVIKSRSFKVPVYTPNEHPHPRFPRGGHFMRCAQDYESDNSNDSGTEDDPENPEWIEAYGCLSCIHGLVVK